MNIYDNLLVLFESFMDDSKRGISENGQVQFNCPVCSEQSGKLFGDGKYNLEVNFRKGKFNCWACGETGNGTKGKISNLIKLYGNQTILNQYWEEIKNIKNSRLYTLEFDDNEFEDESFGEEDITLPKCCEVLNKSNPQHWKAFNYLYSRGIDDFIIKKHNILCTTWCVEPKMRNRIVIPSYDKFNNLNYWVGRNYDGFKGAEKYWNMEHVEKKNIIFNENMIDWDGDVRLVEGPFDHIVVPNSIPLLGKILHNDFYLYQELFKRCNGTITLFLDPDAINYTKIIYNLLNTNKLYNKIRYIPKLKNLSTEFDPSKIFEKFGPKGIIKTLQNYSTFSDFELQVITF